MKHLQIRLVLQLRYYDRTNICKWNYFYETDVSTYERHKKMLKTPHTFHIRSVLSLFFELHLLLF
jgi:uncharacterized membrane protein